MGNKDYTEVQKRKALAAAYKILADSRNQSRYDTTMFGISATDADSEPLYIGDVMNCLVLMHNEMKSKE
jgi:DnaJ-class molecular chaperone